MKLKLCGELKVYAFFPVSKIKFLLCLLVINKQLLIVVKLLCPTSAKLTS